MQRNNLIRKISLISKFMTSQHGKQKNTIQILPIMSESTGNQTKEFGQLIQYKHRIETFAVSCYSKASLNTNELSFYTYSSNSYFFYVLLTSFYIESDF